MTVRPAHDDDHAHEPAYATRTIRSRSLLAALGNAASTGGDGGSGRTTTTPTPSASYFHVVDLRKCSVKGGWAGRQLDGGPEVWCTEGGCRLAAMNTRFSTPLGHTLTDSERKHYQALVLTESLSRHHFAKGAGAGVGMLTQYTTYADTASTAESSTPQRRRRPRPALTAWCDVPEYHAAPVQRAAWRPQF